MALYRETATGFVQEWATNPGAGYTAISTQPSDTIDNKVAWWRLLDTFSQTSTWHPSLPGGAEFPGSDTRAGSGINIMPNDYASFEWAGTAPPMATASASVARSTAAVFHGVYGLRFSVTQSSGIVWFAKDTATYNLTLNPNGKWIVSAFVRPVDNLSRSVILSLLTSGGTTYQVTGSTTALNNSWVRISGVFDLSADASQTARLGIGLGTVNVLVDIDAVMLEEKVGPLNAASTFNSPWGTGISTEQYPDYGIPQTKLYQDLGTRIDLIDAASSIPGSVNARLKTTSDTLNAAIGANGSAIITLQNTDATQATQINALGTRLGSAESSITTINQTTASQATTITQLQAKDSSHDSSITNLNTVTANQATSISSLTTRTSNSESNITSLQTTTSNQATSISTLSSQVGTNTAAISTQSSVIGGLQAQYMVKTDVNGYVAGFGLYNNGPGDSGFLVRADKFAIGFPGNSNRIPFYVDSSGTYLYTAFIKDATITTAKIGDAQITTAKIGTAQITTATIADAAITTAKIGTAQITTATIADAAITNAKIGSLAADKITTGTLDAANLTVHNLRADSLTVGTLNGSQITAGAISGSIQTTESSTARYFGNYLTQIFSTLQLPYAPVSRQAVLISANVRLYNTYALDGFYIDGSSAYIRSPAGAYYKYPMNCTIYLYKNGSLIYLVYQDLTAFARNMTAHLEYIDTAGGTNNDYYQIYASCNSFDVATGSILVAWAGSFGLVEFKR